MEKISEALTVSILGCGWFGKAAGIKLCAAGVSVKGSVTKEVNKEKLYQVNILPFLVDISADGDFFDPGFFNCDVLIISIPPKFNSGEGNEYLSKVGRIIKLNEAYSIKKVIYISSTGVYGDNNRVLSELDTPEPDDEQGNILLEAERLFTLNNYFKTTIIRFGGLIGPGRDPGRFFAGKINVPNGQAPVNLIHLDDCVSITLDIIKKDCFGYIFNAVMPYHPDKNTFYTKAALQAGLTQPVFLDELKAWKIVNSVNLKELLGYQFNSLDFERADFKAGCNI